MMRVVPGRIFLNANDLIAATMVGIVLELLLGRRPAHLGVMLRLVVHLLLLSEMMSPAGVFDLESLVEGELVRLMMLVHFWILVMAARSGVDEVPFVRVV